MHVFNRLLLLAIVDEKSRGGIGNICFFFGLKLYFKNIFDLKNIKLIF
jgi:hypothetical protein